jgi:hypothetical protein
LSSSGQHLDESLRQLVDEVIQGHATVEQYHELSCRIVSDQEACQFYVTSAAIHARLGRIYSLETTRCPDTETTFPKPREEKSHHWTKMMSGSILAIMLSVGLISLFSILPGPAVPAGVKRIGFYEVVSSHCPSSDSQVTPDRTKQIAVYAGDRLRFACQTTRFTCANGVVMTLTGPAELQLESLESCRLFEGKIVVHVPKGAEGFRVKTARSEVIDYGTDFGISVNDQGESKVAVFNGEVGVGSLSTGDQTQLLTGQGVTVNREGHLDRLVMIDSSTFSEENSQRVSPLITNVEDNIRRSEVLNYYRIVSGAMLEDQQIYVDRVHEFNGIDQRGVPEYLRGGELLMTFNDDKVTGDFTMKVTLAQPADLYLLYDTRLETPVWLAENFMQLDDRIGVDEQTRTTGPERLGVGAGVSVDNVMSVWKRRIPQAGSVTLGHNGMAFEKRNLMYSVIAVPIEGVTSSSAGEIPKESSSFADPATQN